MIVGKPLGLAETLRDLGLEGRTGKSAVEALNGALLKEFLGNMK